jgi:hypothetical protein
VLAVHDGRAASLPERRPHVPSPTPNRRFLVAVDMEKYGRQDNLRQYRSQQIFKEVMEEAVNSLGLDRSTWTTQQGGDGEFAVLPVDTPEPVVVAGLVPAIDRILREHNRSLLPEAKVRLRVALHQGLVHLDGANGFPATAVVEVCRLRDAPPVKKVLAAFPAASVALIVSDPIYHDVVRNHYEGLRPERFAEVDVDLPDKGFRARAWIYVPDEDVSRIADLGAEPNGGGDPRGPADGRAPAGDSAPVRSDTYTFHGVNTHGPTNFGPNGIVIGTVHHGDAGGHP